MWQSPPLPTSICPFPWMSQPSHLGLWINGYFVNWPRAPKTRIQIPWHKMTAVFNGRRKPRFEAFHQSHCPRWSGLGIAAAAGLWL